MPWIELPKISRLEVPRMPADADELDTEALLSEVEQGDNDALRALLLRHRQRLRQMILVRLDERLAARVDASDVVQETLIEAAQKLPQYLIDRPIPFYPWLRQIARKRLERLHEYHITAQRRSVHREQSQRMLLSDRSVSHLAQQLPSPSPSPSEIVAHRENCNHVRAALLRLSETDREILVLRFLEHLSPREIAEVLEIREGAVRTRQLRALQRLQSFLKEINGEVL